MLLEVSALTKSYGARTVLDQAAFQITEGGITGLIGPNGAGKTTLFEALAGLIQVDSREVLFRGQPLRARETKQALFYMPDGISPWPDQTVIWLLRFHAGLYGATRRRAEDLADALQLSSLRHARAGALSKGESKRLLLAVALLTPQPLLLLDEPFDGLDFRQKRDVMELLKTVTDRTLFLSIHQLNDAARVCGRFVLLSRGRVAGEGTMDELRAKAQVTSGGGLEEIFLALT